VKKYKTGKKPATPDTRDLQLRTLLPPKLPPVPTVLGHELTLSWGMLANDQYGCCAWSGSAHERMIIAAEVGILPLVHFTNRDVLDDYASTGFNPSKPDSDQGTDLGQLASYRRRVGIRDSLNRRWKDDAYAWLEPGNLNQLAQAVWLFNTIGIGVLLPPSAEDQFDRGQTWTVVRGEKGQDGHYVPIVGRNLHGNYLVVTWGRLHAATPQWIETYMDEGLVYLNKSRIMKNNRTIDNFDLATLDAYLASLSQTQLAA
jgi:hypothetical protein